MADTVPKSTTANRWVKIARNWTANKDVVLAVASVLVVAMLIVPLPTVLLDFLMIVNIVIALMIILTSIYARHPLEFSVFPTVLLFSTIFRLAVNVSSTRLILSQGTSFDGKVVRAFSNFVVSGNYVVGFIIFIIITAAQFIVINRGASRVSEVGARFKLDSLPGKQMAIDADLNAGLLTEQEAIDKRKMIQEEADFYGSMDGASKFVSGDVKLGIVITLVNIIGGIIVGTVMYNESLNEAFTGYVMLAIGDGLVSQVPSLLISTATGIIVTQSANNASLGDNLTDQIFKNEKILYLVSGFVLVLAFMPGFPSLVFLFTSGVVGFLGYSVNRLKKDKELEEELAKKAPEKMDESEDYAPEKMFNLIQVDPLEVELGYALIPLVDEKAGGDLLDRIKKSRKQIVMDYGLVVPQVRITDNMQLEADEYVIKIHGEEVGRSVVRVDKLMAMNANGGDFKLEKEQVKEPVFGLPAYWVDKEEKEQIERQGFTVVDGTTVVATHFSELIKRNGAELLGRKEIKTILDNVKKDNNSLIEEFNKSQIKLGTMQKVLQELLRERVSIRNITIILEVVCDYDASISPEVLVEYIRSRLKRQISSRYADKGKQLHVVCFASEVESELSNRVVESDDGVGVLNLSQNMLSKFIDRVSLSLNKAREGGYDEIILVSPYLRKPLYKLLSPNFSNINVISMNEVAEEYKLQVIYTI